MSFTNDKEYSDRVLLYIIYNDLKNENEKLKQYNRRLKRLIDYLILAFVIIVYFFVDIIIKS